jgi:hypothetical protein
MPHVNTHYKFAGSLTLHFQKVCIMQREKKMQLQVGGSKLERLLVACALDACCSCILDIENRATRATNLKPVSRFFYLFRFAFQLFTTKRGM